jgi:uncharacterized membrane protein YhaH (DUF805 family)
VTDEPTVTDPPRTATLRWAVWLLTAEAVVLAGVTAFFVYEDVAATPDSVRDALAITGYFAVLTLLLAGLAWALARRRAWARGPAIVLELMLVPVGYYMLEAGQPAFGVPVIVVGLAGAGLLLAPPTREALGIR